MPFMKAHGQLDMEEDYEDYEGAEEDLDYEESDTDSVIPTRKRKLRKSKCCNPYSSAES